MSEIKLPNYHEFMDPVLQAIRKLGGSGTNEEINATVAEIAGLTEEQLQIPHKPGQSNLTRFEYRTAWARSYLKKVGILENSARGVWAMTAEGSKLMQVDGKEIAKEVRKMVRQEKATVVDDVEPESETIITWRDELRQKILSISPDAFERLAQRILRESGFIQVEVTGRSGDGGIDGRGIMRLGGMLSFHVIFQCKRWQGAVGSSQVRDFRGSMIGRADKGLIITTGTFTRDAVKEATRDGAPNIDLIDGEMLLNKLKELSLGVKTEEVKVEKVNIHHDWFASL
jgi:restriction system protein